MSLKSFFNSIFAAIASIFHNLEPIVKKAIDIAFHVVNNIKDFDAAMPMVGDLLSHLLPQHLGDEAINILRNKLPEIAIKLRLVDVTLGLTDPNEIMQAALKVIESMDKQTKNIFLNSLSIMIGQEVAGANLPWDVAVFTGKYYFDHNNSLADPNVPVAIEPVTAPVPEATVPVDSAAAPVTE